jgi:hypothetical protein
VFCSSAVEFIIITMFALRQVIQKSSVIGRRNVTNSFTGPVHPFFGMLKATPAEKALENPLVPVRLFSRVECERLLGPWWTCVPFNFWLHSVNP